MTRDVLAERIHRLGVHRNGETIISSTGGLHGWLIDLRRVFLKKESLEEYSDAFWRLYKDRDPFQIGGMETAAIPLLSALVMSSPKERAPLNAFIIRKERKTTGLGKAIEGDVTDEPIILIDDIFNSGGSAEKARAVIEATGRQIAGLFVVIDYRSRMGLRWREASAIPVQSLFSLSDFGLTLHPDQASPRQRYRQLWRSTVSGGFPYHVVPKSTPLLAGEVLYRGCDAGKMHAFDAANGAILWEYQATGAALQKGIWSSPAHHDGRLFFGAYNGVVYCLDAKTGREIWTQSSGEWVGASPIVVPKHGLVYIGLEFERPWAQGSVCALDIRTGNKVWERLTKKYQHGSPAYWKGGDLILWGTADHAMAALEAKSGKVVWVFPTRRSVKYAPAIDEERRIVAFASFDKSIYVLDVATGRKLGAWETNEICYTTPLIVRNRLFCGSGDRHLYVIDLDTMKLLKKVDAGARVYSSPRAIGDRVVFGTNGGKILEIDANSLETKGVLQLPDAVTNAVVPSLDGTRIYVSTYMNDLYAFERLADAPS
ncbi:Outer membrane protein assembly factor BamB, contains PQQ-like beta-propeller repeat [Rhizobiales bacterium GAS191]|nr:Outer membrane protein assembly factor BamB, contains PQQ-like beta-propeller repeat [Rhizobiales bacterium GAS191]